MRVSVRYFAAVRELVGLGEEALDLPAGVGTVAALAGHLEARHPALAGRLGAVRFAVDERFVDHDARLREGAVVALIPPVAGGAPRRVAIRAEALSVDAVLALVRRPEAGAVALFLGTVRDHDGGAAVSLLEYEAYASMATGEIERIVEEIEAEVPGARLAVHHRVGTLEVGDLAVVCAASAPHRGEAFDAARLLIDRVKERAPIWKRQRTADGARWVGWDPPAGAGGEGPAQGDPTTKIGLE